MTFRILLILKAVVSLTFGLLLLFAPATLLALFGTTLTDGGAFTAREYGAALSGIFMLTWFARNVSAVDARRAILLDLLVYDFIGTVITLVVVLTAVLNLLALGIVAIYLFFTVASAYLLIRKGLPGVTHVRRNQPEYEFEGDRFKA